MADKRLVKYVNDMLKRGYSADIIKQHLLKSGYDLSSVNQTFNETYEIRHVIHLSPITIIVIIFVIAIISSLFYFKSTKSTGKLLDLSLEPIVTSSSAGDEIIYIQQLDNKGSKTRFDVEIRHELIKSEDFKVITSKTETRAIETFGATRVKLEVPATATPGDYILRTTAYYGEKKAIATLPVKVLEREKIDKGIDKGLQESQSCDDNNKCTSDRLIDGECINEPIIPCCGNGKCESNEEKTCQQDCKKRVEKIEKVDSVDIDYSKLSAYEALDKIKEKAGSDAVGAFKDCDFFSGNLRYSCYSNVAEAALEVNYCKKIDEERIRDDCFSNLAKAKLSSSICKEIKGDSRRDSCYLTFALDHHDYSVCSLLTNKELKESCHSLRRLR